MDSPKSCDFLKIRLPVLTLRGCWAIVEQNPSRQGLDKTEEAMDAMDTRSRALTVPNLLSAFRILLVPVMVWLYCGEGNYPLTAGALLLSGATDVADGYIARRFHMVSDLGKVLDPVADKLTQAAALGCLLTQFQAMWWVLGALVCKETVMAALGVLVIRRTGQVHSAAWHGKLAACVLYGVILIHVVWRQLPAEISALLAAAGSAAILLSLILYTVSHVRRLRNQSSS